MRISIGLYLLLANQCMGECIYFRVYHSSQGQVMINVSHQLMIKNEALLHTTYKNKPQVGSDSGNYRLIGNATKYIMVRFGIKMETISGYQTILRMRKN